MEHVLFFIVLLNLLCGHPVKPKHFLGTTLPQVQSAKLSTPPTADQDGGMVPVSENGKRKEERIPQDAVLTSPLLSQRMVAIQVDTDIQERSCIRYRYTGLQVRSHSVVYIL